MTNQTNITNVINRTVVTKLTYQTNKADKTNMTNQTNMTNLTNLIISENIKSSIVGLEVPQDGHSGAREATLGLLRVTLEERHQDKRTPVSAPS